MSALDEFADGEQIFASAERHFGISMRSDSGSTHDSRLRHYSHMIAAWAAGNGIIDGREGVDEFRSSIRDWLHDLREPGKPGRNTLAFTSAGTIAMVLCEILGLKSDYLPNFAGVLYNASVTEIVYTPSRITLRTFNVSSHLPRDLLTLV
ncbi:histidine phosphatase family protein [Hydrocarboniphaga sp.]|uniref:histidine phosphatase family protein n=1 Tax=Hydrocarboniphaga sp. TaxID=2033016 RepID=UPI00261FDF35|nr:histidine phosphatase family protein [Hydrocarboniphaga sp.]